MPTLYDNFSQVRQYIDEHLVDVDLSSYVSYAYLESKHYLDAVPSDYPTYAAISSMGYITSIPSEYVTQDELSANAYITINDVPTVDLSSYVSYTYLESKHYLDAVPNDYPTYAAISDMAYITINDVPTVDLSSYVSYTYLESKHYLDAVPSEYPTYAAISNMAYVTSSDLPVIDENIIPKETGTYTLGDSNNFYNAAYTTGLFIHPNNGWINTSNWQTKFRIDGNDKYMLTSNRFYPYINGAAHLGSSGNKWGDTYTANIYTNTAYLQDTSYTKSIVPAENATYTLGDSSHIYSNTYSRGVYLGTGVRMFSESSASSNDMAISLGGVSYFYLNTNRFAPNGAANNEKLDLGTADRKWNHIYGKSVNVDATYTSNLYADTIHNFIWTGTSAEYAALSDYTTYQIYLIQEA